MQRYFYATPNDLLPALDHIDSELQLAYVLMGLFDDEAQTTYANGSMLPTLAESLSVGSAISSPGYLVTERSMPIRTREVQQNDGSKKYAVDQLLNPNSIVFQHGGFYSTEILLPGRVATVSDTPAAMKIQRVFSTILAKSFTRVKAYWVGQEALALLQQGTRLTVGADSSSEFDLKLN
ncbi:hypothetical protein [Duganella vulcania]|uniref:Uncharacterized protein n=1 Tax=Duganella vulcania TaxID=2692166 RepID=A0A845GU08_9BURK|nr:hypothetical protein [Duganella vulcania]MYM97973.1 hypothetical protein [Duganella vulcania]